VRTSNKGNVCAENQPKIRSTGSGLPSKESMKPRPAAVLIGSANDNDMDFLKHFLMNRIALVIVAFTIAMRFHNLHRFRSQQACDDIAFTVEK
jgi:hypothetical protein